MVKDVTENPKVGININLDTTPILFTDNIFIMTNPDGIVLNVMQSVMGANQLRVVSRIGMSREHAKKVANELGKLLALTEGQSSTGKKNE